MVARDRTRGLRPATLLTVFVLVASIGAFGALIAPVHAATPSYPPLTATISGPGYVGQGLSAKYEVSAQGGPASLGNSSSPGIFAYSAHVTSGNVSNATISPAAGVLVNGSVNLTLSAPSIPEQLVFTVKITSSAPTSFNVTNQTENFTETVTIVQPYHLVVTLYSTTSTSIAPFNLTIFLDGAPVGQAHVPTIAGRSSYPATFDYVTSGLSPGTHTFTISLTAQHGLVVFANGAQSIAVSFYVTGPPPDYTLYYVGGAIAFVGAIFIWLTLVAARRRGRRRK